MTSSCVEEAGRAHDFHSTLIVGDVCTCACVYVCVCGGAYMCVFESLAEVPKTLVLSSPSGREGSGCSHASVPADARLHLWGFLFLLPAVQHFVAYNKDLRDPKAVNFFSLLLH